jgi:hypothetical protein
MKVFKTVEEACGSAIIVDDIDQALHMAQAFMEESADGNFNIEVIDMPEDEFKNLKESMGC